MSYQKIVIAAKGGPSVLRIITEEHLPEPAYDEIRIHVEYAGVAFGEILMRRASIPGLPKPPFTPGSDIVGIVDKTGSAVSEIAIGDRVGVFLLPDVGGYTQYRCVKAIRAVKIPNNVDPIQATAATMNYITAFQMFKQADLHEGNRILVHGGGGGIGTALLEFARLSGVRAYASASSEKQALVKEFQAIPIDYTQYDFVHEMKRYEPDGVRAVFDAVGSSYLRRSYSILGKQGVLVSYGFSGDYSKGFITILGGFLKVMLLNAIPDGKKVMIYQIRNDKNSDLLRDQQSIYRLLCQKKIQPAIHAVVPFEHVREAHELLEGGKVKGKIVLDCQ